MNKLNRTLHKSDYLLLRLILAFLAVCAVNDYLFGMSNPADFKNGIFSVFLYITIIVIGRFSPLVWNKKDQPDSNEFDYSIFRLSRGAAIFTAAVLGIGSSIYRTDTLDPIIGSFPNFLRSVLYTAGMAYILHLLIERLLRWFKTLHINSEYKELRWFGGNARSLLLWWAGIFLAWVPCWLAYFPGLFSYDIGAQLWFLGDFSRLNDYHTIIHTLFVWLCHIMGGTLKNGIIVYSIAQMAIMSFIFSYALYSLAKLKTHFSVRVIALAWFALYPFNSVYALAPTKDVLFTGALILLTLALMELVSDPAAFFSSKKKITRLMCFLLLFCLLRKNAIYIIAITAVIMPFVFRKQMKQVLLIFGSVVITGWLITSPLVSLLGWSFNDPKEMLSVPAQQVAYVAKNHLSEFNDREKAIVNEIFPFDIAATYNPRLADPIKQPITPQNVDAFFKLWIDLFTKYPVEYTEAFLTLNLPYWYPDAAFPDRYSNRMYIEDHIGWGINVERQSVIPWLLNSYEKFTHNETAWQQQPLFSTLMSIGTPIWVVFTVFLLCLAKKKGYYATVLLPSAALWLTNLAGPVSNVRYTYPLIAAYPVYIALAVMLAMTMKGELRNE